MHGFVALFGMPGGYEFLIFAFIALLLFGHRLPSVMRSLGRGVVEFKKGVRGMEEELDEDSDSHDRIEDSSVRARSKQAASHDE